MPKSQSPTKLGTMTEGLMHVLVPQKCFQDQCVVLLLGSAQNLGKTRPPQISTPITLEPLSQFCKNRARDMPMSGVYIPKFCKNLVKFSLLGAHAPNPAPIVVKFGVDFTPNFTPIGTAYHPCGLKNLKIAPPLTKLNTAACASHNAGEQQTQLSYAHNTGQPVLVSTQVNNCTILLQQNFIVHMQLLTTTNKIRLWTKIQERQQMTLPSAFQKLLFIVLTINNNLLKADDKVDELKDKNTYCTAMLTTP